MYTTSNTTLIHWDKYQQILYENNIKDNVQAIKEIDKYQQILYENDKISPVSISTRININRYCTKTALSIIFLIRFL